VLALAKDLHGTLDRQRNIAGSIDRSGGWPAAAHASSDSAASVEPRPGSWAASGLHVDAVARTARAGDGDVGVVHAVEELRRWSASTAWIVLTRRSPRPHTAWWTCEWLVFAVGVGRALRHHDPEPMAHAALELSLLAVASVAIAYLGLNAVLAAG
jgi:hypothetical protein